MRRKWIWAWGLVMAAFCLEAKDFQFCGYTWTARSGHGGPGPNNWEENNVWLDASTNLHLKITRREGKWSCAEMTMRRRLGFGRYQFQVGGPIDRLDPNVVLGLFNYPTADVGRDATHEIDIEFARWGKETNPIGNYTLWPVEKTLKQVTHSFAFTSSSGQTTHRFVWSANRVKFESAEGFRDDTRELLSEWTFAPPEAAKRISSEPMPVHINLWLFQGKAPKNGQEVEVVIRSFVFTP